MNFFKSSQVEEKKLIWRGALNALGTAAYIVLVVAFMNNGKNVFSQANDFFAGIVMLTLFVLSALVTSSLVLGKPIMLYLDGRKKEGVKLLAYTAASLAIFLALVILILLGVK